MRTLVVIPTYNERENIETAVRGALSQPCAIDVLVVDDASPDGTGDVANALAREYAGRVTVAHRDGKRGLGTAYMFGFAYARERGYGAVCEMDADGSHDPADLPRLIAAVAEGAALAIGSRRVEGGRVVGWGPHRHLMSAAAATASRAVLGLATEDVTAGFRCYRADAAAMLLANGVRSNGYAFQEETLCLVERAGMPVIELPVTFRDRTLGKSKLSWREVAQFFGTLWRLRGARPLAAAARDEDRAADAVEHEAVAAREKELVR